MRYNGFRSQIASDIYDVLVDSGKVEWKQFHGKVPKEALREAMEMFAPFVRENEDEAAEDEYLALAVKLAE